MNFREKVRNFQEPIFTFTLTPPAIENSQDELQYKLKFLASLQNEVSLDAINIPEIPNEQRNTRVTQFNPRVDPLCFAKKIRKSGRSSIDLILDKIVVKTPWSEQQTWFSEALSEFGNVLLVGGESSQIKYPGPAVDEAAEFLNKLPSRTENCSIGAIAIPNRRHHGQANRHRDEPHKMLLKASHGVDYFISQVIYESGSTLRLLEDYIELLQHNEQQPARLILSFAPVSSPRDIEFLRWWDVVIPLDVEGYLLSSDKDVLERSINTCGQVLQEIINYIRVENIAVPLGVNVEHVSTRNLEGSIALSRELSDIYSEVKAKGESH